jgi:RNA polymerase sigma-54 factor
MLQLSRQELDEAIELELEDNPALERLEDDSEPITEEAVLRAVAPAELKPSSDDVEFRRSLPQDDTGQTDWTDLVASGNTLWDHLRAQLLPSLPSHLAALAEYVIASVNERGYLDSPIEEIALESRSELADVETVVAALRNCEPAGVGAFDLQECLLLQLRSLNTLEGKLARIIVKRHMDDLVARRTERLMRRYRVLPEVVEAAFEEILALTPYPGESHQTFGTGALSATRSGITPDLAISIRDGQWEIDVRGADPASLSVSRSYLCRRKQLEQMSRPPRDERRHIVEYIDRADNFIQSIAQRRKTLRRIGDYLIEHQAGFVSTGRYQFLQSLTRSRLAQDIGMHESTVSRATMRKFVQIVTGEVVPFEVFFKPALRIQKMIEEIMAAENPQDPLSDEQIAALLARRGVIVARRTVNKYRDRTKLLSSHKRRTA